MTTVCIESPFAGDQRQNILYARACMKFCFDRGNYDPFVPHLLYTQIFDDEHPSQRELCVDSGTVIGNLCDERWFFLDFGWSPGMKRALEQAKNRGQLARELKLEDENGDWEAHLDPSRGFRAEPEFRPMDYVMEARLQLIARYTPQPAVDNALKHLNAAIDHIQSMDA